MVARTPADSPDAITPACASEDGAIQPLRTFFSRHGTLEFGILDNLTA